MQCENMAMREALENIYCPQCDGPPIGEEERERNIEKMKMENQMLRDEYERISNFISRVVGRSFLMNPPNSTLGSPSNSSDESLLSQNICDSPIEYPPPTPYRENNHNVRGNSININNTPIMSPLPQENYEFHHDDREKSVIFEIVVAAIGEMVELFQVNNPIWIKSPSDERCFIHRDSYDRIFSNPNRPYKSSTARIESSRDYGVVPMTAIELIQNFLDPMYEKVHVLSPLVESREFFFIRCCKQIDSTTWMMVDVSYDLFKEFQSGVVPSYSWKFPSGCVIQEMGNGQSLVTWIEHVQVYDKNQVHPIYRDLLCDRETYGAKRWIVTLQRMSERYNFAMGAAFSTRHDLKEVVTNPEGMKNVMQISQRMIQSFCEILSMTDNLSFPASSQLNSGDRFSIRKNEEITQPKGFIATASTSLCLPLSFQTIFNFFKDHKTRPQWDVLTDGNNVIELARVPTGTFPENSITIIQPFVPKENNMLVLQESSIDEMGAFIIYAPIDLRTITSIINGDDSKKVSILPSGLIISPDGRLTSDREDARNASDGSILTVAFQIVICANDNPISHQQHMDAVATVHHLLSSTVLKIKAAFNCSD
ncbi:hypothetical protein HAX54_006438 [Datura stramonium]|uniref:START domain-containing protein n=1 Tax=Datura stramonium TaxID=4076 RepID=A0ABS8WY49_DATST|nr:hypothetical protein [Datura stramonium]